MKLTKIAFAVLTIASCLAPLTPAQAGPLDQYGGSILDPNSSTLAKDPRALCSDVVRDETTETRIAAASESGHKEKSTDTWDNGNTWDNHNKKTSEKGGGFGPFSVKMNDSNESSQKGSVYNKGSHSDESEDSNRAKFEQYGKTTKAVAAGKNCDAFVTASAARDAAAYAADGQVKMTEIATKGKVEAVKIEANAKFMESLMKW